MELLLVYLWLKLDTLTHLLVATSIGSGIGLLALLICYCSDNDNQIKRVDTGKKNRWDEPIYEEIPVTFWQACGGWGKAFIILFIAAPIINFIVPSSKEAAILFGTHYAVKAVESPEGQKVMTLMRKRVNDYLDNEIKAVTQEPAK